MISLLITLTDLLPKELHYLAKPTTPKNVKPISEDQLLMPLKPPPPPPLTSFLTVTSMELTQKSMSNNSPGTKVDMNVNTPTSSEEETSLPYPSLTLKPIQMLGLVTLILELLLTPYKTTTSTLSLVLLSLDKDSKKNTLLPLLLMDLLLSSPNKPLLMLPNSFSKPNSLTPSSPMLLNNTCMLSMSN